jgi:ferredoxin-fold anticodon binding domain-containing protein
LILDGFAPSEVGKLPLSALMVISEEQERRWKREQEALKRNRDG